MSTEDARWLVNNLWERDFQTKWKNYRKGAILDNTCDRKTVITHCCQWASINMRGRSLPEHIWFTAFNAANVYTIDCLETLWNHSSNNSTLLSWFVRILNFAIKWKFSKSFSSTQLLAMCECRRPIEQVYNSEVQKLKHR